MTICEWSQRSAVSDEEHDSGPTSEGSQFDVVAKFGDIEPGDVGPSIPTVPDPTDPDVDVDGRVHTLFWSMVVVIKLALLATSLGLLMIAFDRYPDVGWQLLAAGLVLAGYGLYRFRRSKRRVSEIVHSEGDPDDPNR